MRAALALAVVFTAACEDAPQDDAQAAEHRECRLVMAFAPESTWSPQTGSVTR